MIFELYWFLVHESVLYTLRLTGWRSTLVTELFLVRRLQSLDLCIVYFVQLQLSYLLRKYTHFPFWTLSNCDLLFEGPQCWKCIQFLWGVGLEKMYCLRVIHCSVILLNVKCSFDIILDQMTRICILFYNFWQHNNLLSTKQTITEFVAINLIFKGPTSVDSNSPYWYISPKCNISPRQKFRTLITITVLSRLDLYPNTGITCWCTSVKYSTR